MYKFGIAIIIVASNVGTASGLKFRTGVDTASSLKVRTEDSYFTFGGKTYDTAKIDSLCELVKLVEFSEPWIDSKRNTPAENIDAQSMIIAILKKIPCVEKPSQTTWDLLQQFMEHAHTFRTAMDKLSQKDRLNGAEFDIIWTAARQTLANASLCLLMASSALLISSCCTLRLSLTAWYRLCVGRAPTIFALTSATLHRESIDFGLVTLPQQCHGLVCILQLRKFRVEVRNIRLLVRFFFFDL